MAYTRAQGREFWYDFDNQTLFRRTPEVNAAIAAAYGPFGIDLDAVPSLFRASFSAPNHPEPFRAGVASSAAGFRQLADIQTTIMRKHFGADLADLQQAYIDFGQGVLFDNRRPRPRDNWVHQMDGSPDDWVGYHRWHGFACAALACGAADADWRLIKRCIGLAWGVQTEADPPIAENNPGLPAERVDVLDEFWMNASDEFIDRAFVLNLTRAPSPEAFRTLRSHHAAAFAADKTSFVHVFELLEKAATTGKPRHGRFWLAPLEDFKKAVVKDLNIIAEPGQGRGARSNLVKALKGEIPFGPDGDFPRMPLGRPPMAANDIAYIERWIDENCPP